MLLFRQNSREELTAIKEGRFFMKKGSKGVGTLLVILLLLMALGSALAESELGDNEYLGENAHGVGGTIRVKVTMDGDTIQAIQTLEQHETRGLGTTAIMQLTKDIVSANSTEVDSVSGATLSSVAFKAAVRQAVETAQAYDPTTGIELGDDEYLGLSPNALGGRLMVKVTVKNGAIAAIDVIDSHESPEIGETAIQMLIDEMVKSNSATVDTVSGATVSSNALCEAVAQAVEASVK